MHFGKFNIEFERRRQQTVFFEENHAVNYNTHLL